MSEEIKNLNLEELEGLDTNELMQAAMNGTVDPQMQEIMERNMPALMGLCTYAVWLLSVVLIGSRCGSALYLVI